MAEAVQLVSAVASLIEVTERCVTFIRRLCGAEHASNRLLEKLVELKKLIDSVQPVVLSLENDPVYHGDPRAAPVLENARACFHSCQRSLDGLIGRLERRSGGDRMNTADRFRFVVNESDTRLYVDTIKGHMEMLHMVLTSLTCVNIIATRQENVALHAQTRWMLYQIMSALSSTRQMEESQAEPTQMGLATHGHSVNHITARQASETSTFQHHPARDFAAHLPDVVGTSQSQLHSDTDSDASASEAQSIIDTLLATVVKQRKAEMVQILIEKKSEIDVLDVHGWTLFHHTIVLKDHDVLEALIQSKNYMLERDFSALLNRRNREGQTALMICAEAPGSRTHRKLAQTLLESGADPNVDDWEGRTALYFSVRQSWHPRRESFVQLLVDNGATFGSKSTEVPQKANEYEAIKDLLTGLQRSNSTASTIASRRTSDSDHGSN